MSKEKIEKLLRAHYSQLAGWNLEEEFEERGCLVLIYKHDDGCIDTVKFARVQARVERTTPLGNKFEVGVWRY